ncbi:hypothetical protein SAMN05192551_10987 [Tindallia magadiensis]|uniref:Uncharacterized protein n=1 Tax=Tindallia magadiensis TaxID=69895 RepID=A0A1I3GLB9_9FIRM|nr:hypothetical protein [Tindallia magadiensis]SFI24200.1 hypothetical protein SAMN05192551_10987 [Tindallia magadiensis]
MNWKEETWYKEIERFNGSVALYMKDLVSGDIVVVNQKEKVHAASTIKLLKQAITTRSFMMLEYSKGTIEK